MLSMYIYNFMAPHSAVVWLNVTYYARSSVFVVWETEDVLA